MMCVSHREMSQSVSVPLYFFIAWNCKVLLSMIGSWMRLCRGMQFARHGQRLRVEELIAVAVVPTVMMVFQWHYGPDIVNAFC